MENEICTRTVKSGGKWCERAIIISLIYAACCIITTLIIGICNGDVFSSRCEECDDAAFSRILDRYSSSSDFVSQVAEYFGDDQTKAEEFISDAKNGRDVERKILVKIVDYYTGRYSDYDYYSCSEHSRFANNRSGNYFEGLYWIGHGNTLLGIFCAGIFLLLKKLLSKTYTLALTNKRISLTIERKTLFNSKIVLAESYQLNKLVGYTLVEISKKKCTVSQLSFKTPICQKSIYVDTEFYAKFVEAVNNAV